MAVVSRTSIKKLIDSGDIVVRPYDENKINNCSIDVRLGEWYFRQHNNGGVIYPYGDSDLNENIHFVHMSPWNPTPLKAEPITSEYDDLFNQMTTIISKPKGNATEITITTEPERRFKELCGQSKDQNVIILHPGEIILATTEEFIGSRLQCTTMAKTKSSLARYGIDVCGSSGWGDIGYINRWAFPIHNRSNFPVILKPGTWIGQIVFLTVTDKELSYTQGGSYQSTDDFEKLVKEWDPRSVLPKVLSFSPPKKD